MSHAAEQTSFQPPKLSILPDANTKGGASMNLIHELVLDGPGHGDGQCLGLDNVMDQAQNNSYKITSDDLSLSVVDTAGDLCPGSKQTLVQGQPSKSNENEHEVCQGQRHPVQIVVLSDQAFGSEANNNGKIDIGDHQTPTEGCSEVHDADRATHSQISHVAMDQADQAQGREIQDLLRQFRLATSSPLSRCVLQTPSIKLQ
jgi:hypothetical protein